MNFFIIINKKIYILIEFIYLLKRISEINELNKLTQT